MDRFDGMWAFVRVVECGSFTKAALSLRISKTSVTHMIQGLEARLGVRLFHRTTRQVKPTREGSIYYERVLKILADLEDADAEAATSSSIPSGKIRVDVPSPFARFVLIPAMPEFCQRFPEIQIDLGVSDRKINLVSENVDCVIRGGSISDLSIVAKRIGELSINIFASPDYIKKNGVPSRPSDLESESHRIVAYLRNNDGANFPMTLWRGKESIEVKGNYKVAVDDGNAYLQAGLAGLGVLWLPTYMARTFEETGELQRILPEWIVQPMPMYAAFPPNRRQSLKVKIFTKWVCELMEAQAAPFE